MVVGPQLHTRALCHDARAIPRILTIRDLLNTHSDFSSESGSSTVLPPFSRSSKTTLSRTVLVIVRQILVPPRTTTLNKTASSSLHRIPRCPQNPQGEIGRSQDHRRSPKALIQDRYLLSASLPVLPRLALSLH